MKAHQAGAQQLHKTHPHKGTPTHARTASCIHLHAVRKQQSHRTLSHRTFSIFTSRAATVARAPVLASAMIASSSAMLRL